MAKGIDMNETKDGASARLEEMLCEKSVLQKIFGKNVFWLKALPRVTFQSEEDKQETFTLECDQDGPCLVYFSFVEEREIDLNAGNLADRAALFIIGHDDVDRVDLIDVMEKKYSANPGLFAFNVIDDEDAIERD